MTTQQPIAYDAFVELAAADPAVVGLVLKGSRAHEGMTTEHSDHDLYVVLADGATTALTRFAGHRTSELDLVILSLDEFRAAGMPGFERYALAPARTTSTCNGSWPDSRCPGGTPACCSTPRTASRERETCPHNVVSSPRSRQWPAGPGTVRCWTRGVRTWT